MKKSTRILLVIILCLVLIAISLPGRISFNSYQYDDAARYTAGSCEIDQQVKNIDVSWVAGKVIVDRHGGDEIILTETASRGLKSNEEVHWLLDGDTLYVKYARAGVNLSFGANKELTLLLPDDLQLDQVMISSVSAQVEVDLPKAENVSLQSVSGMAEATLQQAETVRVNTVSGDVLLRLASAPHSIDVDGVSANVTIQLPEKAGFTAEMDSVSGRIGGELLEGTTGVKSFVRGNGACSICVDTVSGSLQLNAFTR